MKIAITSDLHGILPEIEECDILLICGDIVPLYYQFNMISSESWFQTKFLPWCRDCPAKNVVFIAGNHDIWMQRCAFQAQSIFKEWHKYNIYYLCDSFVEIEGLKIYGTPYCHTFGNWAFMADDDVLETIYSKIPEGMDIIITHDAPYGVHDVILERDNDIHIGNIPLYNALVEKKPKYHFSGHLHGTDHNECKIQDTVSYSVSLVDEAYDPVYPVLYLNVCTSVE